MMAGLQLYYRFDSVSGSRVGDIASGSVVFDATLENDADVSNNQLELSAASSQYMSINSFSTGDAGMTFATWWRSDNSGNLARLFDFGNGPGEDNIFICAVDTVRFFVIQEAGIATTTEIPLSFNSGSAWNHVAWTLDPVGSGIWTIYINGTQIVPLVRT
eukprot:gene69261-biopygen7442